MRHSHHSRRHHDTDGRYSTDGFSLQALLHALGREYFRESRRDSRDSRDDRDSRENRAERDGRDERDDDRRGRRHGHHHRGFEDFGSARRGFAYGDRSPLHALWHAIGGHHHRRGERGSRFGGGSGGFGGGPGGYGGGDGDGFPRGRKFTSDDLQLMLLALLDAQPSHGYELIKALETRSNGFYSPSPGMVYPALTYLEELGYVTVQLEGNRKRYELAEPGRQHLADNRDRVELMLAKLTHIARKMDSVRRAFAGQEALDPDEGGWLPELIEARRALKLALFRRDNVPAAEQRRIAGILARATAEIEGNAGAAGTASGTGAGDA
jgi:DNA-binding PadR family transcriptional regulator